MTVRLVAYCTFVTSLLLFAGGCTMVGPDFHLPTSETPSAWQGQDRALFHKTSTEDSLAWWRHFHDPQLNRLIQRTFTQNLTLQTAALRIMEARAQLAFAWGTLYPQEQKAYGSLETIGSPKSTDPRYFNASSAGFDLGWEIDFWGKFRRSIESADASYLAAIADYDDLLVSLSAEVARIYVNICTLEERIRLARKNAKIQEDGLTLVNYQFEAGMVTELDVLQAKTLLSSTRSTIPAIQGTLYANRHALAVLLGILPEELEKLLPETHAIPSISEKIIIGAPADLLRRRPDIRRAEMKAAAQCAQIGVARAELFPSFTLFGSLSWYKTDAGDSSLSTMFDADNVSYGFGPTFSWKILHYGRLKNQVRIQDAKFQELLTSYQNTVLEAAREVEDGLSSYMYARKEAEHIRRAIATSKKSMELATLQYEEGFVDYQRVLDSTRSITQKQDQYAQLKGKITTSAIALYKAMGGGWQVREGQDYLPEKVKQEMEARTDWNGLLRSRPILKKQEL